MGILLAIHVLVTVFLILIVLIQKTEGGSSLFASGGGGSMFNARGTSNMLTKATWVLASMFLLNCIAMAAIDSSRQQNAETIIDNSDKSAEEPQQTQPQAPVEGEEAE
ncbi:MAG: preprotein translocase subunit SecG [Alphaproteobacteria bacterium]|nr:preprotein translocase subunit SecG [Alphaproteobacteria bacterium]